MVPTSVMANCSRALVIATHLSQALVLMYPLDAIQLQTVSSSAPSVDFRLRTVWHTLYVTLALRTVDRG